jgi:hypothetical protein
MGSEVKEVSSGDGLLGLEEANYDFSCHKDINFVNNT